jgi:hypothetical protein
MKPLPAEFALCWLVDRRYTIAPSLQTLGRTFDRREIRATDAPSADAAPVTIGRYADQHPRAS